MNRLSARQRTLLVVGVVLVVLLGVTQLFSNQQTDTTVRPETSAPASATASPSRGGSSGLPVCTDEPAEVADAVAVVRNNGPYLRPRDDGGIFGNRERLLPRQASGYYREYTVEAPGQRFPGPRRLITGGQAKLGAEPTIWFYTADHYESFCELVNP